MSTLAADMTLAATDSRDLRIQLVVHAAGGLLALFAATLLSVYKPWGLTPYGRRRISRDGTQARDTVGFEPAKAITGYRTPRCAYVIGFHVVGLVLLFLFAHLTGFHGMSH
jgi:hypothetical protein